MPSFSVLLIGNDSLTIQCGKMLLEAGNPIRGVVTHNPAVRAWANKKDLHLIAAGRDLAKRIGTLKFDWLLSIANLDIIPDDVLALPARGAVNFHDGPLPAYAGLNAPVWALLNGEATHGITWHMIEGGVDEGDIVVSRAFEIAEDETALSLNAKCFAAALESFGDVMDSLGTWVAHRTPQDLSQRTYFGRHDRPVRAGLLAFDQPAARIARLVRALDHGDYRNPLSTAKFWTGSASVLVARAEVLEGSAPAGTVLETGADVITVACSEGAVRLSGLRTALGTPFPASCLPTQGSVLSAVEDAETLAPIVDAAAKVEGFWQKRLADYRPALWSPSPGPGGAEWTMSIALPKGVGASQALAAFPAVICALCDRSAFDLALGRTAAPGVTTDWVPVRFDPTGGWDAASTAFAAEVGRLVAKGPYLVDLPARMPDLPSRSVPMAAISLDAPVAGAALTLCVTTTGLTLHADPVLIAPSEARLIADRVAHLLAALPGLADDTSIADLPLLPEGERNLVVEGWNDTAADFEVDTCVHQHFEAQTDRTPDATALVFEAEELSYAELNARANRIAHRLIDLGVAPGDRVGLHLRRSADLIAAALGILKAGGAYVPLDPTYPADRIALYIEDSAASVIVTDTHLEGAFPEGPAQTLLLDTDEALGDAPATNPACKVTGEDLAYLIYTSGSTGRPKGVMIEHRNVSNFFTGMDERIARDGGEVWLSVTSMSFDISVLELFWTLARGFKVVISGDESRALVSGGGSRGKMDFSLFYWGNDDGVGRDKYALLLDGARFADESGFCAVWTPERHFHAFGGPYPNPSVTGAAVAAVTRNLAVRAGSCVAPLHHTARIAEEWAVIDNLTNGRAGLAIASGWQPDDFVLRPENTPPNNKPAMYDAIRDLRALWSGEKVPFATADGGKHRLLTQPRPVSKTLPIWVTTAGNPDTWREAGEIGANVLTHLLGQSIDEVAGKIEIYHAALRKAGHDPADFSVTLMLHSYLAADRDTAREIAREPMKDYLRSAAALIKQYAWAFPAFKKPKGVETPMNLDLGTLQPEELEAILDFAFERYFTESGLFGTVEDALARVDQVRAIGVTEIACLIDYGIERQTVLDGLRLLAEVVSQANEGAGDQDWSIAAQIARHGVSHMQCTPSMARMLVTNEESRAALSHIRHLLIGGEALPGALVAEIAEATDATIENMYGPTETTIWSTTQGASADQVINGIGTPIANTRTYVLDDAMRPCPVGVTGQLWIGGAGVARGYWQREDLTADRFRADPFVEGGRIYGTGDLARWRADGGIDFLGRVDHQVKLRGHRIELGEIEAALEAEDGVTQAVVIAREDTPGLTQLVAYVTGRDDEAGLRGALAASLPPHMIPARIVTVEAFPLTPNKKVDRNALPAPLVPVAKAEVSAVTRQSSPTAESTEPGDSLAAIAAIWSRTLGVEKISPKDSFFDLGGHSLLAVQAHRDIRAELGVKTLSITDIFRFPTLSALAARVDSLGAAKPKVAAPPPATERPAEPQRPPVALVAETPDPKDGPQGTDVMSRRRALRQLRQQR
jgi:natural product biosynthesis luciferase-like monooxygenase protein